MYPTTARTLAVAFAAGTFAITAATGITACSDDDVAPRAASSTAVDTTDTSADDPTAPGDTSASTDATVLDEIEGDPVVGGATPLPATDAAAVRDELIELAAGASFGTGSGPDFTILQTWFDAFPAMERTLFDDQPAGETVISSSSAFLMEDVTAPGDQAFAWAVLDSSGRCAGAVAVIPGNPDGSVSDSGRPSVFAPVDDLTTCTARAAIDALAQG